MEVAQPVMNDEDEVQKNNSGVNTQISPLQLEGTLEFVESELKRTISMIDVELATLENRMNASNKLSAVGYQAKASLIGHRLDAARSLAQLSFKKKEVDLKENNDGVDSRDIVDLLMAGKK